MRPLILWLLAPVLSFGGLGLLARPEASSPSSRADAVVQEAATQDPITALLPARLVGQVRVASIERLEAAMARAARAAGEEPDEMDLAMMAGAFSGLPQPELVDPGKPLAIALVLGPEDEPSVDVVYILPISDMAALEESEELPPLHKSGSYVGIRADGPYELGAATGPMAGALPKKDVVIRLDLASLVTRFRERIDEVLDPSILAGVTPPGPADEAARAQMEAMFGMIKEALDASETLEMALDVSQAEWQLDSHLTMKADRKVPLAGLFGQEDLRPYVRALPEGWPLLAAASLRFDQMATAMKPFMDVSLRDMPEEARAPMRQLIDRSFDLAAKSLSGGFGLAMRFTDRGMEVVEVIGAKDPAAYLQGMREFATEENLKPVGVHFTPWTESEVDGVKVLESRFRMDDAIFDSFVTGMSGEDARELAKKVIGENGMRIRIAATGNQIVAVGGEDEALLSRTLAALKSEGTTGPAAIARALPMAGSSGAAMVIDFRQFLREVVTVMGDMIPRAPRIAEGPPVPLTMGLRFEPRSVRASLRIDVAAMAKLFRSSGR